MRIFEGRRCGWGLLAGCMIVGLLLTGLSGCDNFSGRPRIKRTAGGAVTPSDLVGRWKLQYVQMPAEIDFVLIEITHKDKKFSANLVGHEKHPAQPKIKTADIKEDGQVRMEIASGDGTSAGFQGRLDGESIWGSMMMPHFQVIPAKMERTEQATIDYEKQMQQPEQVSIAGEFFAAANSADRFVAIDEMVKKKESFRSPLLIQAYAELANHLKAEKYPLEKVKAFVDEYHKAIDVWGPRIAPEADLYVGQALARQELFPEYARELLTKAEKAITDDYPFEWKIRLAEAWVVLGDHEHGLKLIKALQDVDPTNPIIRMNYAKAKEMAKDYDEALKTYAGLAMLPQLESSMQSRESNPSLILPSEAAARLWKQKHGNTEGLNEYLKKAYDSEIQMFVPQRKPTERDSKGQVVLLELFTGSACSPCVPADIACEALRKAYSANELVVIKYHQHAPLPDPLAVEPGMVRANFYGADKTPTLFFNGMMVPNAGGYVGQTANVVARVQYGVDEEVKKTSPVEVKVSATRKDDEIEIKATVTGITTTDNDPRLILVLLENGIHFHAPNGVRIHDAVARGVAGGPMGIKLKPGEVEHTQKISINKIKTEILEHLKEIEGQSGKEFPIKPLQLANLQVAAIVQKQITKTYVQAALTDVVEAKP